MEKAKVYFTKEISPESVIAMYRILEKDLPGKVAAKVHSGEKSNQNYLRPTFLRPMVEAVEGTVVECNTAYAGKRNSTEKHRRLMETHQWTKYFRVDLMDAGGPDLLLPITGGKVLKENFKGHPAGGYGGALKQLSIGCASTVGKCLIHSGGLIDGQTIVWSHMAGQDVFCEAMADAAGSIVDYFKGNTAYINMIVNLSVDCDCCAIAEDTA